MNLGVLSGLRASGIVDVAIFRALKPAASGAGLTGFHTWTKPAKARYVTILCIGGAGGGGSGARQASGSACSGGAGGGGGGINTATYAAEDLPDRVAVQVSPGGIGGAAQTANTTAGIIGAQALVTTVFGPTNLPYCVGGRGGAGASGKLAAAATAGTAATAAGTMWTAGAGGAGVNGAAGGAAANADGCPGGGAGGGIAAAGPAAFAGGAGAVGHGQSMATPLVGGSIGAPGISSILPTSRSPVPALGPSGGGASTTAVGGDGGDGGYGAGGGGGGSSLNGSNSGRGGHGGDGLVVVISWR